MSRSELSAWTENRIEKALLWLLRLVLVFLLISALVDGETWQAFFVAVALAIHAAAYLGAARVRSAEVRRWGLTLVDVVLAGLLFYLTGDIFGHASVVGFCVAGIVASRLGLWSAVVVNAIVWFIFTFPYLYLWIGQGEPLAPPVIGNVLIYPALTFVVKYLVSMDARTTRVNEDATLRLRQLTTVYEVGRSISSTLEMDAVLDLVMNKAVEILNAEAGSLLLVDWDSEDELSDELVFRIVLGPATEKLIGQRLPSGEGIAGEVFQTGQAKFANDVHADPRWYTAPDAATGFQTRSILCVPLVSRGRSIGVLQVINKKDDSPFDDIDLELLSTFAAQAAGAQPGSPGHGSDSGDHRRADGQCA